MSFDDKNHNKVAKKLTKEEETTIKRAFMVYKAMRDIGRYVPNTGYTENRGFPALTDKFIVPSLRRPPFFYFFFGNTKLSKRIEDKSCNYVHDHTGLVIAANKHSVRTALVNCLSFWAFLLASIAFLSYFLIAYSSSLLPNLSLNGVEAIPNGLPVITQLYEELNQIKEELKYLKISNDKLFLKLEESESSNEEKWSEMNKKIENSAKNCCENKTDLLIALIDNRLSAYLSQILLNDGRSFRSISPSEATDELKKFIHSKLIHTKENFDKLEKKLMLSIENVENRFNKGSDSSANITVDDVKWLINQALDTYNADMTDQPDFALESAGGSIVNTRCSVTHESSSIQYNIMGVPVWSSSVSPRAVIQPTITPGECWPFKGSKGYLVVRLSRPIMPTGFSYEHIPKEISRDGNIDSAPKEFQVRGLEDEMDTNGRLLGSYLYEDIGRPMQYFDIQDPNPRVYQLIELVILSNHGHNEYTCLYRFRVHGKRTD